ncbi:MAG: outer membrane protein assembly factor BamD [Oligoflexia bacterium]|nr:outer membrane protein assembly factor BamD [Oligoflexia bacterium]
MRNIVTCLCCIALVACSSSTPSEPTATEIKISDKELRDAPEAVLMNEGKRLYRAGLFSVAQESFDSLRLNYPNSPYAEFAEIKVADSHFETREYPAAAGLYEDFLKNHPASPAVPYALLRAGRSYQLVNQGVGRDTAPLEKALEFYERVIREYPSTVYAQEARNFRESTRRVLAEYERFVMEFYKKQNNQKALLARQHTFEERWKDLPAQDSAAAPAQNSAAVTLVSERTPINPHILALRKTNEASDSPRARLSQGKSEQAPVVSISRTPLSAESQTTVQMLTLQRVSCSDNAAFIYFDQPIRDEAFLERYRKINSKNGSVTMQLPLPVRKAANVDCFASKDLTISAQGELSIQTADTLKLMTLDNPPRLLLRKTL